MGKNRNTPSATEGQSAAGDASAPTGLPADAAYEKIHRDLYFRVRNVGRETRPEPPDIGYGHAAWTLSASNSIAGGSQS